MGELMAVLDLLRQTAGAEGQLLVLCDSQYVINSITKWMPGWKRKGWRKSDGKPVQNLDLLQQLDAAVVGRDLRFEWVKGHAGHELNEAADERARAAATSYRDGAVLDAGPGFGNEPQTSQSSAAEAAAQSSAVQHPEPYLFSDPDLFSGTASAPSDEGIVIEQEKLLLTGEVRTDRDRLAALLHPQFTEHGRSGRIWSRSRTLAELAPLEVQPTFELLGTDRLAADVMLLRWRARTPSEVTLGSSLWVRENDRWLLRFQQGTPGVGSRGRPV